MADEITGDPVTYNDPYKLMNSWSKDVILIQEIIVWVQYVAPIFYLLGMPVYFFCSYASNLINYVWMWITLIATFDAQDVLGNGPDAPIILEGSVTEEDMETYTFVHWFLFPYRKMVLFYFLNIVGTPGMVIPFVWWIPTIIFGALQILQIIVF